MCISDRTQTSCAGLKTGTSVNIPQKNTKAYRNVVANSIKDLIVENNTAHSMQFSVQGRHKA